MLSTLGNICLVGCKGGTCIRVEIITALGITGPVVLLMELYKSQVPTNWIAIAIM